MVAGVKETLIVAWVAWATKVYPQVGCFTEPRQVTEASERINLGSLSIRLPRGGSPTDPLPIPKPEARHGEPSGLTIEFHSSKNLKAVRSRRPHQELLCSFHVRCHCFAPRCSQLSCLGVPWFVRVCVHKGAQMASGRRVRAPWCYPFCPVACANWLNLVPGRDLMIVSSVVVGYRANLF